MSTFDCCRPGKYRIRSVVVVFPASTWAMMPILRISARGVCRGISGSVRVRVTLATKDRRRPRCPQRAGKVYGLYRVHVTELWPETEWAGSVELCSPDIRSGPGKCQPKLP